MAAPKSEVAERLREVIGDFVRATRDDAGTPSDAQSETLGILDRDGPLSVAELAQRRRVRHQSMRVIVAQLEQDGQLTRAPDPVDRRSQVISITAAGRCNLLALKAARTRSIEAALATLSHDERQVLQAAIPLLRRMITAHET